MTWRGRLAAFLLALASANCDGPQSMFSPQGPAARSIADLGWLLLGVTTAIYLLVMGALAWALMRTRRPGDESPQAMRRLTAVVAGAVVLTAVVLVALSGASAAVGRGLGAPLAAGAVTVDVIGHQWWWDFQYHYPTAADLISSPNELHVPVGVPIELKVQSRDVIHSFWVPALHGKRDLIPGQITALLLQADTAGVFRGQCAEFCGHQHATMSFRVVAEPRERFEQWVQSQRRAAAEPTTDRQHRGRDVFLQSPCATCHAITGTDAGSHVGPDLTHVGSRLTIAAGTFPNMAAHMRRWIANPSGPRPGVRMPPASVQPDDLAAVTDYLRSLR
jgi:cytochrome c oxidase subunit II